MIKEIKQVVIDKNGTIINIGELEDMNPEWSLVEMEMEYTLERGWYKAGEQPEPSIQQKVNQLTVENEQLRLDNEKLLSEDLNNKEAIAELYLITLGGGA